MVTLSFLIHPWGVTAPDVGASANVVDWEWMLIMMLFGFGFFCVFVITMRIKMRNPLVHNSWHLFPHPMAVEVFDGAGRDGTRVPWCCGEPCSLCRGIHITCRTPHTSISTQQMIKAVRNWRGRELGDRRLFSPPLPAARAPTIG